MNLFSTKLSKKESIILIVISIVYIIFYVLRLTSNIFILSDSKEYLYTSDLIYNGKYFFSTSDLNLSELLTKRPFLYPLFLLLINIFTIKIILLIQTLIGILSAYIILIILKKAQIQSSYWVILFFLLTPSIFIYTNLIMTEWLALFLFTILTFLLFQVFSKQRFIYIQIITVLLATLKPVFFPLIYFNLVFFSIYFFRKKIFSIFLFLPILFLISYLSFNQYRTGYFQYSSIENINLIEYNLYYFKSYKESQKDADIWKKSIYDSTEKLLTFKEKNDFYKQEAKTTINQNLISYSWYHFFTSIRGMIDPGRFDLMTFFKKEDGKQGFLEVLNSNKSFQTILYSKYLWVYLVLIPIILFQIIKFLCFLYFIFQDVPKLNALQFYLFCLALLYIFLTGPVNCSRLMMPLQGFLIIITLKKLKQFKNYAF